MWDVPDQRKKSSSWRKKKWWLDNAHKSLSIFFWSARAVKGCIVLLHMIGLNHHIRKLDYYTAAYVVSAPHDLKVLFINSNFTLMRLKQFFLCLTIKAAIFCLECIAMTWIMFRFFTFLYFPSHIFLRFLKTREKVSKCKRNESYTNAKGIKESCFL